MVTNRDDLKIPHFRTDSKDEIESFFRSVGTMEYAQDDGLRIALTSRQPPALTLQEYPVIPGPLPQDCLSDQWESVNIGEPLIKGGQHVLAKDHLEVFGAGRDVFEGHDECHFISRKAGDHFWSLSTSLTPTVDTDTYAKAGLMYRTSLNADAPIIIVSLDSGRGLYVCVSNRSGGAHRRPAHITDKRAPFASSVMALGLRSPLLTVMANHWPRNRPICPTSLPQKAVSGCSF